jgi:hypothetical protein
MELRVNPRLGLLALVGALAASFPWVHAQQKGGVRPGQILSRNRVGWLTVNNIGALTVGG